MGLYLHPFQKFKSDYLKIFIQLTWKLFTERYPPEKFWTRKNLTLSNQVSVECRLQELNQGHRDFQSLALPTELKRRTELCITEYSGSVNTLGLKFFI